MIRSPHSQDKVDSKVELREIKSSDLPAVAAVHLNAFPDSALTKLGPEIVRRYYEWQLEGPHKFVSAVGAFADGECAGYSFSGEFDGSISGFLRKNRQYLIKEVLLHPWLVFNPLFRKRLFRGLQILRRFPSKNTEKSKTAREKRASFGILSIAVSTSHRKLGIGKILMMDAEERAIRLGYKRMHLTVSPANQNAIRFYENLDWIRVSKENVWTGSMIKELKRQQAELNQ